MTGQRLARLLGTGGPIGLLLLIFMISPIQAQPLEISIGVADTVVVHNRQYIEMEVYFSNYSDSLSGFQIWLQLDQPDILQFPSDTTAIIKTGTLTDDWGVSANSLSGLWYDLQITGAQFAPDPGIPPQQGGTLVKFLLEIIDDTPGAVSEHTVSIFIQDQALDHFNFGDPQGNLIGTTTVQEIDTAYYVCTQWAGDECLQWQRVSMPPADSMVIDTQMVNIIDTNKVEVHDGSIALVMCGDVNGNGEVNISDLLAIVSILFTPPGVEPIYLEAADINASGSLNISDITDFVNFLFRSGPPPNCL